MKRMTGISLIEVATVLAIVAILLIFGYPAFLSMMTNARIRGTAEDFLTAVQLARAEAIKIGEPVTFTIESQTDAWTITRVRDDETVYSKVSSGGTIRVEGSAGDTMTFDSLGLRSIPAGGDMFINISSTSTLCQPGGDARCLAIAVRAGGLIRMCDPLRPTGDPQSCTL